LFDSFAQFLCCACPDAKLNGWFILEERVTQISQSFAIFPSNKQQKIKIIIIVIKNEIKKNLSTE
jgi:hypothetical protein